MHPSFTTGTIARLKARDPQAWFELWQVFGPILRAQLGRWGGKRIGPQTVEDLSQETLSALSASIDRHDPARGAKFSTWLLSIARHVLGDEMDRRTAQKRGGGVRPQSLDEQLFVPALEVPPGSAFEAAVFHAKIAEAIRRAEAESDLVDFTVYRLRVFEGRVGREVAESLGLSEAAVSRRLTKVRGTLRDRVREVVATYSFTDDERNEAERKGLAADPNKADDALFDEALAEIYEAATRSDDEGSPSSRPA
ncbi:MAG: sigma-70 family RNA polymerase sigma factor [Planctomycetes bacterium]|nr:sigma-70 family RNA polymerase sigma factor [Planctomycetota bacterium]